jgi:hypothetical protein
MTDLRVIPSTLITFQQVCALYPQPQRLITLKAYWAAGKIPHLKIGNRVYFRLQDVEVWMVERVFARLGLKWDGSEPIRPSKPPPLRPDPQGGSEQGTADTIP